MILLIDNYDSFAYNLYQMIGSVCPDIQVVRNDEITIDEITALSPERIVLSPGPGRPENAGICIEVVQQFAGQVPLLGVCLGHQAIYQTYGGRITHAMKQMHGKQSLIQIEQDSLLFQGLPTKMMAARYHSLAADPDTLPDQLQITAVSEEGEIMAIQHKTKRVYGVQFHPESILTPEGSTIINNFLMDSKR